MRPPPPSPSPTRPPTLSPFDRFIPISVIWAWLAGNVAGANKRAAATGAVFSLGNIGGAIAGQIYSARWAPRYVQGHAVNVGCYVLALAAGAVLWWSYRRDNRTRDAAARDGENAPEKNMLGEKLGNLGDRCVPLLALSQRLARD